jgi:uncharacterized protein involved in exopolysaccharide biosynthesis
MVRGLVIAATAGAAFGALVVFEPFGRAPPPVPAEVATAPGSLALQQRIEALRLSLRDTESALDAATSTPTGDSATRAQFEAQIAAAIERRDLALRHAEAIRESLDAGVTPSSLAAIRDSVVIGQMLTQQVALDARIAVESARLRPGHPIMRSLNAQRTALATQIRQEATSIAAALESEAKIDDAQIALLQSQLAALPVAAAADTLDLEARAAAQRAELDGLVDAYFDIPTETQVAPAAVPRNALSVANLAVVSIAGLAALAAQIFLALRRRRARIAADLEVWRNDTDPEVAEDVEQVEKRRAA